MVKNNKIIIGILFLIGLFAVVYGAGFHVADEVLSGTFKGNYTFDGRVNFSNANIVGITLSNWRKNGNDVYYMDGNVGIGTDNPQAKLDVNGHIYIGNNNAAYLKSNYNDEMLVGNDMGGYYFATGYGTGSDLPIFIGDNNSYIRFKTNGDERLRILNNGNVGIGTTNPQAKLDVAGNIKTQHPWFYAYNGKTFGTGSFANYTGFAPFGLVVSGSVGFTPDTTTSGGYFTAPVNGVYVFSASVLNFPNDKIGISQICFSIDGSTNCEHGIINPGSPGNFGFHRKNNVKYQTSFQTSAVAKINAGQVVKVYVHNLDLYTDINHAFFSGYLLSQTD